MNISESIDRLQKLIAYEFTNRKLVSVAIFHHGLKKKEKSFAAEFERLEFLGDRVLGLALADFLYDNFRMEDAGDLAVRIASLAGTDFLIRLAKRTKIIDCFFMPKDFFISRSKNSSSIADMMEAVFGAVFLDSDFETTKKIIVELYGKDFQETSYKKKDPKTLLQEFMQSKAQGLPVYRLLKMSGELHDPVFEVEVRACGLVCSGHGNSKKNAEHNAAEKMLVMLQQSENTSEINLEKKN